MSMLLSGFILKDDSIRHQLPIIFDPTNEQIDELISLFATHEGMLGLRHEPKPEIGPYRLSLQAEKEGILLKNGKWLYLLMLDQYESDGDIRVRTLDNKEFDPGLVTHWGESYPSRARTRDLELVRSLFMEFAETGDVSESLMF